MKAPIGNCSILQVGTGGSRLAAQLSSRCRHITGVVRDEPEWSVAAGLGLQSYHAVVCDQYSETFRECLPLRAYDVIIDHNLTSHACCQRHLQALMENYSSLLAPTGWLATAEQGLDDGAGDNCWRLSEIDLICLAGQLNLCVTKAWFGIYKVTRCETM